MTKNRDKSLSGEQDRESAVKAQQKGFKHNKITDAEKTFDSKYWYADHIKQKKTGEERRSRSVWDLLAPHTWIKTAPDRKNTVDRRKIYDTTTEAHFLPYVHLLVQAHHSTAKHKSHNSRVMAWAKQFREKWHWALAWKPQDCRSTQMWFWMTSFKSSNYPAELMSL